MNNTMNKVMDKAYEISDKELNMVNGGFYLIGEKYEKPEDVVFKFSVGGHVELVTVYIWRAFTKGCTVIDRKVDKCSDGKGYCAWYKVSCDSWFYDNEWYEEKEFEGGFSQCLTSDCM